MKKLIIPLILAIILIAFFKGFVDIDTSKNIKKEEGIVYGVTDINTNLEKITKLTKRDEDIICATSRGLVEKDSEGKIVPSLAKEINVKDDGIEYEINLNDDVYWSDGSKITSSDIINFFKELIISEDSDNIEPLLDIYGARDFKNGKGNFERDVAITGNEEYIKVRLNKKNDQFIDELTKPQYRVRKSLPLWADISNSHNELVYTGIYSIKSADKNEVKLSKNKLGEGPKSISLVKDENEELAMAAFEIGNRDIVLDPPKSQLNKLQEGKRLVTFPSNEGYYISINSTKEELPLQGRREIYKNIYEAIENYDYNYSKRIEVAEGSYFRDDKDDLTKLQTRKVSINKEEEWKKVDTITLLADDSEESRDLCKFFVSWFKDKMSINLKYSLVKEEDMKDLNLRNRYDLTLFNRVTDSKDRLGFYKSILDFLNEQQIKVLEKDINDNSNNFSNIENKLFNDYSILPIMFENKNIAISKNVSNITVDGNGNLDFSKLTNIKESD